MLVSECSPTRPAAAQHRPWLVSQQACLQASRHFEEEVCKRAVTVGVPSGYSSDMMTGLGRAGRMQDPADAVLMPVHDVPLVIVITAVLVGTLTHTAASCLR
jgi:hypothetical protein